MDTSTLTAVALGIAFQIYVSPIPEVSSIKVLVTYSCCNLLLAVYLLTSGLVSDTIVRVTTLNITFLTTACLLTLVRRAFFSPLANFPGPPHYALTNLFKANLYRMGKNAYTILDHHIKYDSDVIRIGPNELSIRNVEAIERLYKGKYPRGTFYGAARVDGATNLNTEGDYELQTPWRRIWERAFANSHFKDYNVRVEHHTSKLLEVIRKSEGKEINALTLVENFVFDIMADLAFAHNAGMQDGTRQNDYMGFIHKYMATVVMLGALRPLHALLPYLPKTADIEAHRQRGLALLSSRLKLGKTRKDLFTHLLDADATFTSEQLYSNSSMIIIAGTDTTSSTMTQLFRALALNPQIQKKMQCEIDEFCAEGKHISVESTKGFGYINAVISESLRLFNPVPGGIYAATPPSGLTIPAFGEKGNETFVPGNVQVMIPHLALMTDPRYFPKGDEFIPERWTGEWNAGVLDRRAYIPFGYGVHSCVGKQLALNEMRLAVASIVKEWDIVLGEQYDEKVWKYGIKDYHTVKVGELWAKFVPRKV